MKVDKDVGRDCLDQSWAKFRVESLGVAEMISGNKYLFGAMNDWRCILWHRL